MSRAPTDMLWTEAQLRDSPAFRSLTATALLVLMDFNAKKKMARKDRRSQYKQINNGELVYTYAEAESRGIKRSTFSRALKELQEKGFIDLKKTGGGLYKVENEYALSGRWVHWGTAQFEAAPVPPGRRANHGFQQGNALNPASSRTHTQMVRLKNVVKNEHGSGSTLQREPCLKMNTAPTLAVFKNDNEAVFKNDTYENREVAV